MPPTSICVVGSVNLDLNSYTDRLPAAGETIHARQFTTGHGGKGANQAVMAARLGGAVALVARVGNDLFGRDALEHFRAEGISTTHVTPTDGASTGTAVITVDAAGRNTIVVSAGANGLLSVADIEAARGTIEAARVLVCQQEVPSEANLTAMRIAERAGVLVVFNPAPVGEGVPVESYPLTSVLCPNEHEAALLTGLPVRTPDEARTAGMELLNRGVRTVIVTLGAQGCMVVTRERAELIPAPRVEAVDTTGAGDAFIGSLAHFLARGEDVFSSARSATQVASISVQRAGTQTSFPRLAELTGVL